MRGGKGEVGNLQFRRESGFHPFGVVNERVAVVLPVLEHPVIAGAFPVVGRVGPMPLQERGQPAHEIRAAGDLARPVGGEQRRLVRVVARVARGHVEDRAGHVALHRVGRFPGIAVGGRERRLDVGREFVAGAVCVAHVVKLVVARTVHVAVFGPEVVEVAEGGFHAVEAVAVAPAMLPVPTTGDAERGFRLRLAGVDAQHVVRVGRVFVQVLQGVGRIVGGTAAVRDDMVIPNDGVKRGAEFGPALALRRGVIAGGRIGVHKQADRQQHYGCPREAVVHVQDDGRTDRSAANVGPGPGAVGHHAGGGEQTAAAGGVSAGKGIRRRVPFLYVSGAGSLNWEHSGSDVLREASWSARRCGTPRDLENRSCWRPAHA